MKKINKKDLELTRRIIQVVTIIICAVLIPVFLIFLVSPSVLIPGYSYDEYGNLYIIYTVLFIFVLVLAGGINFIVKRYIKRSIEEVEIVKEEPSRINERQIAGKTICSSCGEEILDSAGDFCSKCGAPIK